VNLNLITLASVKTQLGIASGDNTYDTKISALIPVVSSDIRRILNCSYDKYVVAAFSSSTAITISNSLAYDILVNQRPPVFSLGQVIAHDNIPDDKYLESYDTDTGVYTMSAAATGSGSYVYPTVTLAMFPAISKMIWYKISKMNITDSVAKGIQSETYGPVSITYSAAEINKRWDYPQTLITDLGIPYARIG